MVRPDFRKGIRMKKTLHTKDWPFTADELKLFLVVFSIVGYFRFGVLEGPGSLERFRIRLNVMTNFIFSRGLLR